MNAPSVRVARIQNEIGHVASLFGVTSWEREFMASVKDRNALSDKQETILKRIEAKVFQGEAE